MQRSIRLDLLSVEQNNEMMQRRRVVNGFGVSIAASMLWERLVCLFVHKMVGENPKYFAIH